MAHRNPVDLALRALWKERPHDLLRLTRGLGAVEVRPQESALRVVRDVDGVAEIVRADGSTCRVVVEFETDGRESIARRMAHAAWALHGARDGSPVRGVVLLVAPRPDLPSVYDMRDGDDVLGTYRFEVVCLADLPAAALLDVPEDQLGLVALVPLARDARVEHVGAALERIHAAGSQDARELYGVTTLLATRTFGYDQVKNILSRELLMESETYRGWRDEFLAEGRAEGHAEAARQALLTVARARFGDALDELVVALPVEQMTAALEVIAAASSPEAAEVGLRALR